MRWKELTNLISISRLLSGLSALLNKRDLDVTKKKPAVLTLQFRGVVSASRDSSDVLLLHCSRVFKESLCVR